MINGSCSIWSCRNCTKDSIVVGKSIEEVYQFTLRNTNIKDLIGNHPYQDSYNCQINSYALRMNHIPIG